MGLEVVRATDQDLEEVFYLFAQYLAFYKREHPEEHVRAFLTQRLEESDSLILLARVDGYAVGLAQIYPTQSSLRLAPVWVLNDLIVASTARRSGVGRALVRAVCEGAAASGVDSVSLKTAEDNYVAQSLYKRERFERERTFWHYSKSVLPTRKP